MHATLAGIALGLIALITTAVDRTGARSAVGVAMRLAVLATGAQPPSDRPDDQAPADGRVASSLMGTGAQKTGGRVVALRVRPLVTHGEQKT